MQHSVKFIAELYSESSQIRGDKKLFDYNGFLQFAKDNQNRYHLMEIGDDFLVSTRHSNDLIKDYQKTL